ncbi:MAG: hypothetical protein RLZZ436_2030 [Planctomycetota bacterium]|jgi:hypothetical protein
MNPLLRNRLQLAAGLVFWLSLAGWATLGVLRQTAGSTQTLGNLTASLSRWAAGSSRETRVAAADWVLLAANDPVFLKTNDGHVIQVGSVRTAFGTGIDPVYTRSARLRLDRLLLASNCPHGFQLEYHSSGESLTSVVETLFSAERRQQIAEILARDWQKFGAEITVRLEPVLRQGAARFASTVESELPKALERRRDDLATLADRYQTEIVRQRIVPLVRKEVLPIIEEEIRPVALDLSRELWDRVSLWSFTWRYLYDVSPLPERNAVRREFERFLQNEIRPAIEARTDDFVSATERVVARISRNEQVRSTIRDSLRTAAADPQLQKVILDVFREAVLENAAVRDEVTEWLKSPEVRELLQLASSRFEPTVREIGDLIFGSRESGISPEFARVLRTQILLKDRRWLMLIPNPAPASDRTATTGTLDSQPVPLRIATTPQPFPLRFESTEQSPLTQPPATVR